MDVTALGQYQLSQVQQSTINKDQLAGSDDAELRQACKDFESIFIKQMLDSMRKTVHKSGLNDGGYAEELYQDMLYDEYANKMAETAQLGIAKMMYSQLAEPAGGKLL